MSKYALITDCTTVECFTPHECEDAFKTIHAHDANAKAAIVKREYSRSRNMFAFTCLSTLKGDKHGYTKRTLTNKQPVRIANSDSFTLDW